MCATTAKNEPCSTDRRALLINGSPRADGPTAWLLAALETSLPATVAVQRFDCFAQPVLPCNDCRACHIIDGCARPDLKEFYRALEDAALLVFASPVYNLSFPAPLKAVIDRTQRYWAARFVRNIRPPIARPKQVVLLTAAGADDPEGGEMLERQLRPVLTILNGTLVSCVHYAGADTGRDIIPFLRKAEAAGRILTKAESPQGE